MEDHYMQSCAVASTLPSSSFSQPLNVGAKRRMVVQEDSEDDDDNTPIGTLQELYHHHCKSQSTTSSARTGNNANRNSGWELPLPKERRRSHQKTPPGIIDAVWLSPEQQQPLVSHQSCQTTYGVAAVHQSNPGDLLLISDDLLHWLQQLEQAPHRLLLLGPMHDFMIGYVVEPFADEYSYWAHVICERLHEFRQSHGGQRALRLAIPCMVRSSHWSLMLASLLEEDVSMEYFDSYGDPPPRELRPLLFAMRDCVAFEVFLESGMVHGRPTEKCWLMRQRCQPTMEQQQQCDSTTVNDTIVCAKERHFPGPHDDLELSPALAERLHRTGFFEMLQLRGEARDYVPIVWSAFRHQHGSRMCGLYVLWYVQQRVLLGKQMEELCGPNAARVSDKQMRHQKWQFFISPVVDGGIA